MLNMSAGLKTCNSEHVNVGCRLAPDLLSNTIIWPLLLGALLAGLLIALGPRDYLLGAIAATMILVIYALLEGLPAFPPVAGKQKLAYLLVANALVVLAALRLRLPAAPVAAVVLAGAFVWLGWNKLFATTAWPQSAALLIPLAAAVFASLDVEKRGREVLSVADSIPVLHSRRSDPVIIRSLCRIRPSSRHPRRLARRFSAGTLGNGVISEWRIGLLSLQVRRYCEITRP